MAHLGIDRQALKDAQKLVEDDGGSFSPLMLLAQRIGKGSRYKQVLHDYVRPRPTDELLVYPDGPRMLARLGGVPLSLITYGAENKKDPDAGRLWQIAKVLGSKVRGYAQVTNRPHKGPEIDNWRSPNGLYEFIAINGLGNAVARFRASTVLLVDDKADAFKLLSAQCRGALVQRPDEQKLKSQKGEVSANVQVVKDLDEVHVEQSDEAARAARALDIVKYVPLSQYADYLAQTQTPDEFMRAMTA